MLGALIARIAVVTVTPEWIEARTIFGGRRRLAWSEIVEAKAFKFQIILSPSGSDAFERPALAIMGAELWKQKSVIIHMNMVDAQPGAIALLIQRYMPGLLIGKIE